MLEKERTHFLSLYRAIIYLSITAEASLFVRYLPFYWQVSPLELCPVIISRWELAIKIAQLLLRM